SAGGDPGQFVRIRPSPTAVNGQPVGFVINTVTDLTSTVTFDNTGGAANSRFVKIGPGTLTLDPRNADGVTVAVRGAGWTDVRIYEGTLAVTAPAQSLGALPGIDTNTPAPIVFANGGRLRYTSPLGGTISQVLTFNGSGGVLDLTGTFVTLSPPTGQSTLAQLVGTGGLTLEGGQLRLSGASNPNFAGGIVLAGGQLLLGTDSVNALGTGPVTF